MSGDNLRRLQDAIWEAEALCSVAPELKSECEARIARLRSLADSDALGTREWDHRVEVVLTEG